MGCALANPYRFPFSAKRKKSMGWSGIIFSNLGSILGVLSELKKLSGLRGVKSGQAHSEAPEDFREAVVEVGGGLSQKVQEDGHVEFHFVTGPLPEA